MQSTSGTPWYYWLFYDILITADLANSELQIRRSNRDNLGIIGLIPPLKHIFYDPPSEPSRQDGSNDGSQHMFSLRNKKNYL